MAMKTHPCGVVQLTSTALSLWGADVLDVDVQGNMQKPRQHVHARLDREGYISLRWDGAAVVAL